MSYPNIFISVIAICVNISAQIFSYKYILIKKLLKSEYFGFLSGLASLIILQIFAYRYSLLEWFDLGCANLIIYMCLSYTYFTFINMGETARRIRLLRELGEAPAGLSKEEILRRYNAQEIIDIRINRLMNNGQIILRDGRYYLGNPTMLFISRILVCMKVIILGRESEFVKYMDNEKRC